MYIKNNTIGVISVSYTHLDVYKRQCGRGIAGDGRKPVFDHCRPGERTGTGRGSVFLTYYAFAGRQP